MSYFSTPVRSGTDIPLYIYTQAELDLTLFLESDAYKDVCDYRINPKNEILDDDDALDAAGGTVRRSKRRKPVASPPGRAICRGPRRGVRSLVLSAGACEHWASTQGRAPVKVGVVGMGSFGRLHALTLAGLAEAELVAVVARLSAMTDGLTWVKLTWLAEFAALVSRLLKSGSRFLFAGMNCGLTRVAVGPGAADLAASVTLCTKEKARRKQEQKDAKAKRKREKELRKARKKALKEKPEPGASHFDCLFVRSSLY